MSMIDNFISAMELVETENEECEVIVAFSKCDEIHAFNFPDGVLKGIRDGLCFVCKGDGPPDFDALIFDNMTYARFQGVEGLCKLGDIAKKISEKTCQRNSD